MPKMLKSKKGISPILATLLLIVIAVAAIIVTYAWVMTFMGAQTTAAGTIIEAENVSWDNNASTTNIVIRNVGTSDVKILRCYIGSTVTDMKDVTTSTDLVAGKVLPVGQTITIVLNWPNALSASWTSGRWYYFKVVPEIGAELEFSRESG